MSARYLDLESPVNRGQDWNFFVELDFLRIGEPLGFVCTELSYDFALSFIQKGKFSQSLVEHSLFDAPKFKISQELVKLVD